MATVTQTTSETSLLLNLPLNDQVFASDGVTKTTLTLIVLKRITFLTVTPAIQITLEFLTLLKRDFGLAAV